MGGGLAGGPRRRAFWRPQQVKEGLSQKSAALLVAKTTLSYGQIGMPNVPLHEPVKLDPPPPLGPATR